MRACKQQICASPSRHTCPCACRSAFYREPGNHPNIALRTYVYHQMLIGYLSFVKMLGFEQLYIWACPPMQVRACRRGGVHARVCAQAYEFLDRVLCLYA